MGLGLFVELIEPQHYGSRDDWINEKLRAHAC